MQFVGGGEKYYSSPGSGYSSYTSYYHDQVLENLIALIFRLTDAIKQAYTITV